MNVTPVMIRTYVRFNKSAFSSRNKKNTSNGGVDTALLSSVASLFQASSSKVKLATLQIVRDCNASEAEPIVVTTSKRIHREIHANFCSREDPQVMGTITRRAFLSCAKNCEDERVATGVVTKCTIDAMDALNLRALANELRRLDRERFYVSIQKALANVCDPYAEILLSGFLFASAHKFYRKVRKIASPEACAKLRKKLFLSHAPNIFFVALMFLMYYSSVTRTSLYSKMRERFLLAMRIHAMFYGWFSIHAATSVVFESANATVDSDTKHLKLVENFRCPQLERFSGFIVVVVTAAIISLMHSAATDVGRHRENFTHRLTSRHRGVLAMHHGRNDRDDRIGRLHPGHTYRSHVLDAKTRLERRMDGASVSNTHAESERGVLRRRFGQRRHRRKKERSSDS